MGDKYRISGIIPGLAFIPLIPLKYVKRTASAINPASPRKILSSEEKWISFFIRRRGTKRMATRNNGVIIRTPRLPDWGLRKTPYKSEMNVDELKFVDALII